MDKSKGTQELEAITEKLELYRPYHNVNSGIHDSPCYPHCAACQFNREILEPLKKLQADPAAFLLFFAQPS